MYLQIYNVDKVSQSKHKCIKKKILNWIEINGTLKIFSKLKLALN